MTVDEIIKNWGDWSKFLLEKKLAKGYNGLFRRLTGSVAEILSNESEQYFLRQEHPSAKEYLTYLRDGNYTLALFDGSLLQVYYVFVGEVPTKHRLCYFPCPVEINLNDLTDINDLEEMVRYYLDQIPIDELHLQTAVRFDYDVESAKKDHPASHITVNSSEVRIPACGPVSAGHFIKFILKSFYPKIWGNFLEISNWSVGSWPRNIVEQDCNNIYFDWKFETRFQQFKKQIFGKEK